MAKGTWIALGVVAAIVLIFLGIVGSAVGTYNKLTNEDVGVDAQGKQVDVQYQRAFRLVPQITELADKYVDKTSDAYAKIVAMRTGVANAQNGTLAEKDAAAQNVQTAFTFMVEAYPEIRSDAIYGTVIDEIINTENKIAAEKTRYNDRVQEFNAHRRQCCLPVIVAGMFGFHEREFIGFNDRPNTGSFGNNTL
ncbi:MAG TPA: LemA family protein [Candidatus Thermoplasmatota archaeon]|nr:LemA family protein [Candidatus Thermoplasmatota archaeon]